MSLVKIFSPQGEPFEVTPLNARDLTSHAGWTYENTKPAAPAAEAPKPAPKPAAPAAPAAEAPKPAPKPAAPAAPAPKAEVKIEEVKVEAPKAEETK